MNIEEKRILKTTCYYYGAGFSDFPGFFNSIKENGDFCDNINSSTKKLSVYTKEKERLQNLSIILEKEKEISKFVEIGYKENYLKIVESFKSIFNIGKWPPLYIVDKLPKFGNDEWESVSIDEKDETYFGIPQGIYFIKSYLTHCYFEFIIAHELMHWVISYYSKEYYPFVSLYEEGICDFFSAIVLKHSNIVPDEAIINLFLYNRYFKCDETIWKMYYKFFNKFILYSLEFGIASLIALIKKGRTHISNFMESSLYKETNNLDDICKSLLLKLLNINSYFTLDLNKYIVLKELFKTPNQYVDFCNLAENLDLEMNDLEEIITELETAGLVFIHDEEIYQPNIYLFDNMRFKDE